MSLRPETLAQGYLILALGPRQYVDMAVNLAASIKVMDPSRGICLVHDDGASLPSEVPEVFSHTAALPRDDRYPGVMSKLRIFDVSPFRETMFVDADCLMVKRDIDRYWQNARRNFFSITGEKKTSGNWKGVDVEMLLRQEQAPYLVQMNSGVFYFDKSPESESFFRGLNEFYLRRKDFLGVGLHRGKPAQTDEIYIGIYMGLNGLDGRYGARFGSDSWMVSTYRGLFIDFDPEREHSVIYKPRGHPLNPLAGWDRLSPTFAHFIGLKPRRLYQKLSAQFRLAALGARAQLAA